MIKLIEAYRRFQTGNRLINYKVPKYLHFKQLCTMPEKLKRSILVFPRFEAFINETSENTAAEKKNYTDSLPGLSN